MPRLLPIREVKDGEAIRHTLRKNKTAYALTICCRCGLKHLNEYRVNTRYIVVRAWRLGRDMVKIKNYA